VGNASVTLPGSFPRTTRGYDTFFDAPAHTMQAYREEVGFLLKRSRRNISMRDHILIMSGLLYEELPGSCLRHMTGSGPGVQRQGMQHVEETEA